MRENSRAVRRVLGDCIATVAHYVMETKSQKWPDLFKTISAACNHANPQLREVSVWDLLVGLCHFRVLAIGKKTISHYKRVVIFVTVCVCGLRALC